MGSTVKISHGLGWGDAITFASAIEEYANTNAGVVLDSTRIYSLQKELLSNVDNIQFCTVFAYDQHVQMCWKDVIDTPQWRQLPTSFVRDSQAEQEILDFYTEKYGDRFILTHHRMQDNGGVRLSELDYDLIENPDGIPVINLDFDAVKSEGNLDKGLLNYGKLIEQAEQVHVYEGSFCCLTDTILEGADNLYWHGYVKPYLWNPRKQPHNQIIGYISDRKWHKNDWTYLGLDKKAL